MVYSFIMRVTAFTSGAEMCDIFSKIYFDSIGRIQTGYKVMFTFILDIPVID